MIENNITIFRWYYFFWRFKPLAALLIIYFSQITKSYALAMAVFSIFNICYSVCKIPSGILSDKLGRKFVIVLASAILCFAFFLLALSGQLEMKSLLFIFAFLWGISEAMLGGTTDALMYETMAELKEKENFRNLYSKSMLSDQLGCAAGALAAMTITYRLPIQWVAWISVLPVFAQFICSLFFVEPKTIIRKKLINLHDINLALKQFAKNKKLLFYSIADIFFSTLGDISHRFESAYFKTFTTEWIISLARVLKHIFGIIGFAVIPYTKKYSKAKVYFTSICCNILIRTVAVIFNNVLSPFIHMFINFFYATASTAKTEILQNEFLQQYRATSQSIILFIKGIYMAALMYFLGMFADQYGIWEAMVLLIILRISGLFIFYIWQLKKSF